MKLSQVMAGTGAHLASGPGTDADVSAVVYDSRKVVPGCLFFALPGARSDGAEYARDAVQKGAVAVVASRPVELGAPVPLLVSDHPRKAMAYAAANFHGRPARALTMLGVTGTNGKTTTTYLVEAMLAAADAKPGVIGTVSFRYGGKTLPATHTTPESVELQALLADMKAAGTRAVVMEVSSHALAQDRVAGISYTSAAFTNLTRDHLDYHQTMDEYFRAKRRLFVELCAGPCVVNADDAYGQRLMDELLQMGRTAWGFTASGRPADLWVREPKFTIDGCAGTLVTPRGEIGFQSSLVGAHNLENILTATGLVLGGGYDVTAVAQGLAAMKNVPGRLERVSGKGVNVFVDYAHTDDALKRALAALKPLCKGRVLTVFGCGGDRDKGKRPLMGEAAGRESALTVVTSDNPRTEDPSAIIADIVPGLEQAGLARIGEAQARAGERGFLVESDRRAAIALAVSVAKPGDVVLLAGKGHEDYQIVGTEKRHFDDREEAAKALGVTR